MKIRITFLLILFLGSLGTAYAETPTQRYWIYLTDKGSKMWTAEECLSPRTIEQRIRLNIPVNQTTDWPLSQQYVNQLTQLGIEMHASSKWLNAVSAYLSEEELQEVKQLPFVKNIELLDVKWQLLPASLPDFEDLDDHYAKAIEQMQPEVFEEKSLNGEGVVIGVIDAGYWRADKNEYLTHLFKDEQILGYKDWFDHGREESDFYKIRKTSSDGHGTTVLRMIAGLKKDHLRYGFADQSSFYLARTDHGDQEFHGEEDYWLEAVEWMDSLGVRIINSSLGYATGFDDPKLDYKPEQMDGQTAIVSKAAQIAAEQKGILMVVSAGNEGNDKWEVVSAPADAQGVLSVGATNDNYLKASYSSIGPEQLPYLKPNVSAYSLFGTSFSAPIVTGFAACLMQYKPDATAAEIIQILEKSSHLYPYGNNYIGMGIPQAEKALMLLDGEMVENNVEEIIAFGEHQYAFPVDEDIQKYQVFHKSTQWVVIAQEDKLLEKGGKWVIKKPKHAVRTTIHLSNGMVKEIFWDKNDVKHLPVTAKQEDK